MRSESIVGAVSVALSGPPFTVIGAMARADTFKAIDSYADIARQGLGQRIHREECKPVAFARFAYARRAEKPISRKEQVDNGSVGTTMHGAQEPPVIWFHDQARFLKQFAGRGRKRVFAVNRMAGRQSPLAVQIASVESALDQNCIVHPDQAIRREVWALELNCHRAMS
jgi:hypothetical protein